MTVASVVGPVVKHVPEDFVVREIPWTTTLSQGPYRLFELRKRGMTTMAALHAAAEALGLPSEQLRHAGLKDEDGVTTQTISIPDGIAPRLPAPLTLSDAEGWAELSPAGYAEAPLRPGALLGNAFTMTIRNLDIGAAEALVDVARQGDLLFVNYYDTQRFGVPGGPRTTHTIGSALADERYDAALALVRESRTREAQAAAAHRGPAADFFAELDPRTVAFYRSAAESARWNEALTQRGGSEAVATLREGLLYLLPRSSQDALRWAVPGLSLPCVRWTAVDRVLSQETVGRPCLVQVRIKAGVPREDEHFSGRTAVAISFVLPSGCYATMATHHLMAYAGLVEPTRHDRRDR